MPLQRLDHVNLRTTRLDAMIAWYGRVLGMHMGDRPPFPFPGAWLYSGDDATVHLIGVDGEPQAGGALSLEHFAFSATGLGAMLAALERDAVPYKLADVPGFGIIQINLWDPDGNHLHVDFKAEEADGLDLKFDQEW
ncbi:MAG: VOC family protein [Hyphomicrobiales bacterium]